MKIILFILEATDYNYLYLGYPIHVSFSQAIFHAHFDTIELGVEAIMDGFWKYLSPFRVQLNCNANEWQKQT